MSETSKEMPKNETTVSAVAMDVSSNAAPSLPPMKTDSNMKYKDDDLESEDVDDEEALLVALEQEKEKEEAEEKAHPHAQPNAVAAAPRMLQDALEKGLVAASDSEEEEMKMDQGKRAASPEKVAAKKSDLAMEEEKKGDDEPGGEPHYHARVSFQMHSYYVVTLHFIVSHQHSFIISTDEPARLSLVQGFGIFKLYCQGP